MTATLRIAADKLTVSLPDRSRHTLDIGSHTLSRRHFHHLPPDETEWEYAIMTVEDSIAPLQALLPPQTDWLLDVAELRPLALSDGLLTQTLVEQIFQRLTRYGSDPALPASPAAYAALLILREWLHHMHISEIRFIP
ncbi:MAG: hypothetical protein Q4G28_05545 [Neisseria sp.]|nr:hypothetical protein [Neisseria sp.]